jgi:hypothetical protein
MDHGGRPPDELSLLSRRAARLIPEILPHIAEAP